MNDKINRFPIRRPAVAMYLKKENNSGMVEDAMFFKPAVGEHMLADLRVTAYTFMERCEMQIGDVITFNIVELIPDPKF